MNAISTHAVSSQFFASQAVSDRSERITRNLMPFLCVLALHIVAGYVLLHAKVRITHSELTPIEVSFIQERSEPEPVRPAPPLPTFRNAVAITAPIVDVVETEVSDTAVPATIVTAAASSIATASTGSTPAAARVIADGDWLHQPRPRYPPAARAMRMQGTVMLRVLIDTQGRAAQITVHRSSGYTLLDEAAMKSMATALFKPYVEQGTPREGFVLIPIEWRL